MREQFVTYEIAKKLKELGFNEPVLAFGNPTIENDFIKARWDNDVNKDAWFISIPLWQQVMDWLIREHKLFIKPDYVDSEIVYIVYDLNKDGKKRLFSRKTKEEAVIETLELIK